MFSFTHPLLGSTSVTAGVEHDYFLARAEAELQLAQTSTHPSAMRAHYLLAGHYLDRVYGEPSDTLAHEDAPTVL